jgi:hypothetical protein
LKTIHTLIPDIYELIKRKDGWFTEELAKSFSEDVALRLQTSLSEERGPPTLRMSKLGPVCPCALWHSIHNPELAEPLPAWAEIKYSFGHILEALLLTLAKAAGHTVEGEQDELVVDGIKGHRDCVIDGCIVDVKSASSLSFIKFKDGTLGQDDSFGYLDQLDAYLVGSLHDPLVTVKDKAYILAVDKQLGHLALYEHRVREEHIRSRIAEYKSIVGAPNHPPCECKSVKHGESGNLKLDTRASYNPFKYACNPRLRAFLYSNGPVYLTKVVRQPDVPEINQHGKVIFC